MSDVGLKHKKDVLKVKKLQFSEGVSMIVGTNIGAGILSLSYAAKKSGYFPLLFWLVVVGIITTITMLYVAEAALRTKEHEQLSGLSQRYVGKIGSFVMFLAVAVNSIGALIAYMGGSGSLINALSNGAISKPLGSIIFFIPAAGILWMGLKAIGRAEKYVTLTMIALLLILIAATFVAPQTDFTHIFDGDWVYMIPVFNIVVFIYCAQYIVPEMARGFAHNPKILPKAVMTGMGTTFVLLALVPLSVISLSGLEKITQVATIGWGEALGSWAFFVANGFALFAMLTSYWGLGGSFMTNIADKFNMEIDSSKVARIIALLIVVIPPFYLAYSGMVGFVDALYFVGVFSGVVLSIMPILILKGARKNGTNKEDIWHCPSWMTSPFIYVTIIVLYGLSAIYAIASKLGYLPTGW